MLRLYGYELQSPLSCRSASAPSSLLQQLTDKFASKAIMAETFSVIIIPFWTFIFVHYMFL